MTTTETLKPQAAVVTAKRTAGSPSDIPAYALIMLMMCPALWWISHDRTPFAWDQSLYARHCSDLWYTLTHTPLLWPQAMFSAFGGVPPATLWLGQFFVPMGQAFGSIESGLLCEIVCIHFCTLVLIYRVGRELCPEKILVPLAGTLFVASAPLSVGLSHHLLNESLQLLAVTYAYFAALRCAKSNFASGLAQLILAVTLAFLSKASSVLYCGLPLLLAATYVSRAFMAAQGEAKETFKSQSTPVILASSGLLATAAWYAFHIGAVYNYVTYASYAAPTILYFGRKDVFYKKVLIWLGQLQNNMFLPEVCWIVTLIAGTASAFWLASIVTKKGSFSPSPAAFVTAAATIHTLAVICVFSTVIAEDARYLLPLLPSIAILVMRSTSYFDNRLLNVFVCSLAAFQFLSLQAQALAIIPIDSRVTKYLRVPCPDTSKMEELQRLGALTGSKDSLYQVNICGVEYPWLNNNTLSWSAAKTYPDPEKHCTYDILEKAESDPERSWAYLSSRDFTYFISVDEASHRSQMLSLTEGNKGAGGLMDVLNQASTHVLSKIRAAENFVQIPFDSKFGITVYQRKGSKIISPTAARKLVDLSNPAFQNISFGNQFILRGIKITQSKNALVIDIVWQSSKTQSLDYINAVHVINSAGEIKSQQDYYQSNRKETVEEGTMWHDTITLPADKVKGMDAVGLCIYRPNQEPLKTDHGPSDWDHHRLLIKLKP